MTEVHCCFIVPAALQKLAQDTCCAVAGLTGKKMFITEAVHPQSGAVYYASNGYINTAFLTLLNDPQLLFEACAQTAFPITLAQCQALLTESDITDQNWLVAFARLGLEKKEKVASGP